MEIENLVHVAQHAAQQGSRPHTIIHLLATHIRSEQGGRVSYVIIEACLVRTFRMPLREARDIERWVGLSAQGDLDDDAIDQLLNPWLAQYTKSNPE